MEPVTTTIKGTEEATGLGKTEIYELINEGKLETVQVGRRRLVKTASIHRLVAV